MIELPKKIKDELYDYCKLNNITNIDEFILKIVTQGFVVEKYGAAPTSKEKIVEVQVEKIIEKIVEVPVDKIIEKIVEKEVYITDDSQYEELTNKIVELENKLNESNNELSSECENKLKEKDDKITLLTNLLEVEKRKKRDIYGE
jgi:hypothetical protein